MGEAGSEPAQNAGAAPGQRLRRERERRGISTQKVAEDLHVDPWIVEALESSQFQLLGAPVYAKGHLKKYAALLGLDSQTLVAEYGEPVQTPALAPLKGAPTKRFAWRVRGRTVGLTAAILVVAIGVGWKVGDWRARSAMGSPEQKAARVEDGITSGTAGAELLADGGAGKPASTAEQGGAVNAVPPAAANSKSVTRQASASQPPASSAAARTNMRLRLSFAADSWVEVYDANERRVLTDLASANTARSLTVSAPARLSLGNAEGVQVEVNGQPVSLPRSRGGVLHVTIDSQGRARISARPASR